MPTTWPWNGYPESHGAIVSVAGFYKDISTLVTTKTLNIPFHNNPFGIPDSAAVAACGSTPGCNASDTWAPSRGAGQHQGRLGGRRGGERYQQPFTFLPGFLSHTGMLANVTYVDSSVLYPNGLTGAAAGFVTNQLLGLSKYAAYGTLYYEDDRWSARASIAYRSKYLSRVPGQEVGTDADGFDATVNVDASVQYTINSHFKGDDRGREPHRPVRERVRRYGQGHVLLLPPDRPRSAVRRAVSILRRLL